jgi:SH3-like domain-containing protein
MPKIIISYRRADTQDIAMRIRDGLKKRYGPESVFTDIDSIPYGKPFLQYINDEIASADALLAVVGHRWLRTKRGDKSNLQNKADYVRLEIEAALTQNIKVAPILVGGAKMPEAEEMPESIRAFVELNAASVDSGVNFENDLNRLIGSLDKHFKSLRPDGGNKQTDVIPEPPVESVSDGVRPDQSFMGGFAPLKAFHREIPVLGFAIGASVIAALAALVMGFFGHARASLVVFCGMMIAMALVFVCSQLTSHRNRIIARLSLAAIWTVSLVFISFLALTATAAGLKRPVWLAEALGYEVEDSICSSPLATQKAYSCDTDGDWVVVGIGLDDSDKVTLNIRQKPDGAPLRAIPPNSTKLLVGVCSENWCPVKCESVDGWSKKKYLQPRSEQLYPTQGSSLPGASGLAIRSGPHQTCHAEGFVQSGRKVILHGCEPNPTDPTQRWCRITHDATSGWLPDLNLDFSKGLPEPNLEPAK